jgi:hypothetical protein
MQNRGVVDGVFTFGQTIDESTHKTILQKIKEKFGGPARAREPLVIGSDASYTRLAMTPAEMDFISSRRWNREEIFGIFGVPLPLAGSSDTMTYNNFSESTRILWETAVTNLLDMMKDSMDHHFRRMEKLGEDERIGYDTSGIEAMRQNEESKARAAREYWNMGFPPRQINEKLGLGFDDFEGADIPFTGSKPLLQKAGGEGNTSGGNGGGGEDRSYSLVPDEQRNYTAEAEAKDYTTTEVVQPAVRDLLEADRDHIFARMDEVDSPDETMFLNWIEERDAAWVDELGPVSEAVARDWAGTVAVDERGARPFQVQLGAGGVETRQDDDELAERIQRMMEQEQIILTERSHINETTVALMAEQFRQAREEDWTIQETKQAIEDAGAFGPVRGLRISRTVTAASSSVGQLAGAESAGARTKQWNTSEYEVRQLHVNRSGERVGINEAFSVQSGLTGPRYPGDPRVAPEDRINCRCSLTFSTRDPSAA